MISIDYTLIIVILNFIFLLIILNSILYKPLKKFLTDRQTSISSDVDQAESFKKETETLLQKQQEQFKQSSLEIRKLKDKAKKDAESMSSEIIKEARIREKEILLDAEKQLVQEKNKAILDVENKLGDIITNLTAKIIGKNIDQEIDAEIINKLLLENSDNSE